MFSNTTEAVPMKNESTTVNMEQIMVEMRQIHEKQMDLLVRMEQKLRGIEMKPKPPDPKRKNDMGKGGCLDLPTHPEISQGLSHFVTEGNKRRIELLSERDELPLFNGADPQKWIYRTDQYLKLANYTENQKLMVVRNCFIEEALDWYRWERDRNPFRTWEEMKWRVLQNFSTLQVNQREVMKQDQAVWNFSPKIEENSIHGETLEVTENLGLVTDFVQEKKEHYEKMLTQKEESVGEERRHGGMVGFETRARSETNSMENHTQGQICKFVSHIGMEVSYYKASGDIGVTAPFRQENKHHVQVCNEYYDLRGGANMSNNDEEKKSNSIPKLDLTSNSGLLKFLSAETRVWRDSKTEEVLERDGESKKNEEATIVTKPVEFSIISMDYLYTLGDGIEQERSSDKLNLRKSEVSEDEGVVSSAMDLEAKEFRVDVNIKCLKDLELVIENSETSTWCKQKRTLKEVAQVSFDGGIRIGVLVLMKSDLDDKNTLSKTGFSDRGNAEYLVFSWDPGEYFDHWFMEYFIKLIKKKHQKYNSRNNKTRGSKDDSSSRNAHRSHQKICWLFNASESFSVTGSSDTLARVYLVWGVSRTNNDDLAQQNHEMYLMEFAEEDRVMKKPARWYLTFNLGDKVSFKDDGDKHIKCDLDLDEDDEKNDQLKLQAAELDIEWPMMHKLGIQRESDRKNQQESDPVEDFEAAMKAEYGWDPGKGMGTNAKEDIQMREFRKWTGKETLDFCPDRSTVVWRLVFKKAPGALIFAKIVVTVGGIKTSNHMLRRVVKSDDNVLCDAEQRNEDTGGDNALSGDDNEMGSEEEMLQFSGKIHGKFGSMTVETNTVGFFWVLAYVGVIKSSTMTNVDHILEPEFVQVERESVKLEKDEVFIDCKKLAEYEYSRVSKERAGGWNLTGRRHGKLKWKFRTITRETKLVESVWALVCGDHSEICALIKKNKAAKEEIGDKNFYQDKALVEKLIVWVIICYAITVCNNNKKKKVDGEVHVHEKRKKGDGEVPVHKKRATEIVWISGISYMNVEGNRTPTTKGNELLFNSDEEEVLVKWNDKSCFEGSCEVKDMLRISSFNLEDKVDFEEWSIDMCGESYGPH